MRNITELRDSLADNYEQMKKGDMDLKTGKELANTAGKVINSLRVELEYNSILGLNNRIEFLENNTRSKK